MPTTYGTGSLADAIRAAIARPFNDAADPAEFPTWHGAEADYRLHVHRTEAGLEWRIEVQHRTKKRPKDWSHRMAFAALHKLGRIDSLTPLPDLDGWLRWSRPCSAAESAAIEGVHA